MKNRYSTDKELTMVLSDTRGDGNRTIAVQDYDIPANASRVAYYMNLAFQQGYQQAQAEIRQALGVK